MPRSYLHCKCCHHQWRPMRVNVTPACCPKCRNPNWATGRASDKAARKSVQAPPPQPCVHQLTARREYALFLARRAERDAENRQAYADRDGHRRYFADELESADICPPMLQDGTPFRLDKLTLKRRKRRKVHGDT